MVEITLLSLIVPFLITLLSIIFTAKSSSSRTLIAISFVILFFVKLGISYLNLPSRNMLSIINANLIYSIFIVVIIACIIGISGDDTTFALLVPQAIMIIVLFILSIIGTLRTNFNVTATYKSIDKTQATYKEAPTFKAGETPVAISPATVISRTEKCISDVPNNQYYSLGNKDDVQAQYINGEPCYLIPIEYQDMTSYINSDGTIPGYFKIDATNELATPKFVKCHMKYSNSSYFGHNAEREIYRHYPTYVTSSSNPQLQIGPDGTPYWVETMYRPEFLSERADYKNMKVATLNAKTGKTHLYSTKNLPKWISEGITSDVASDMNEVFGRDKYGVFHQWFNKAGMIKPTNNGPENGVTSVFNKDGSISYFADFTNINNDNNSGTGYTMINARTGKLTYYKVYGMMDSTGAKKNANENYKAQKWSASMPVIYKISGRPVWVMQILDNNDAVRAYYYLDAANQSIHTNSSNLNDALNQFNQALANSSVSAGNTSDIKQKNISGTIDRLAIASSNNKVMFTLQGQKTIYTIDTQQFNNAILAKPGDNVSFKANVQDNKAIGNVLQFKDNQLS